MTKSIGFLYFITYIWTTSAIYQWSFQQKLRVPEAGETYGSTPSGLIGRGFQTLISGYDRGSSVRKPGIYIHTSDDGNVDSRHLVWSQQAKLVAKDTTINDQFGKWMVSHNQTIVVSAPLAGDRRGYVYIFNGTLRHWSQVQKLTAVDGDIGDNFGGYMSLHGDRLVIGATGNKRAITVGDVPTVFSNVGAAYVFVRAAGSILWSRQGKLIPRDGIGNGYFGSRLALHDEVAVVNAKNDNDVDSLPGVTPVSVAGMTGSAYVFRSTSGQWSQQQKLVAEDMANFKQRRKIDSTDQSYGDRQIGRSVAVNSDTVALGVSQLQKGKINKGTVYLFNGSTTTNRWSLQQRLFYKSDAVHLQVTGSDVFMDHNNTLVATATGPNLTASYIFKEFGSAEARGWSLQQTLQPCAVTFYGNVSLHSNSSIGYTSAYDEEVQSSCQNFSNPNILGGHLLHTGYTNDEFEVQIRSQYQNQSCLLIWMSDHFLDGWDTAVLTVRAPDLTNDTFHPHCDQRDPFMVRYCPYQPEDEGVYIVKVFAATAARFFWEISWQVQIENTNEWYRGDFSTKMQFSFNATNSSFGMVSYENLVDVGYVNTKCFRCTTIATKSWSQQQVTGDSAFWPLVARGAPYYISDYEARNVYAQGKVCDGVDIFECYQTLSNGVYILRLGGGLFGRLTDFPHTSANWTGCNVNGTDRQQLTFAISDGVCVPLKIDSYLNNRCFQPTPVNTVQFSSTAAPTSGGTVAPSQSTFGSTYKKFQMYEVDAQQNSHDDQTTPLDSGSSTSTSTSSADANGEFSSTVGGDEGKGREETLSEKRRKLSKKWEKKDVYDFEDMFNF